MFADTLSDVMLLCVRQINRYFDDNSFGSNDASRADLPELRFYASFRNKNQKQEVFGVGDAHHLAGSNNTIWTIYATPLVEMLLLLLLLF